MNKLLFLCFLVLGANAFAQSNPGAQYQSHAFQYLNGVLNAANPITLPVANAWNSVSPPQRYTMSVTTTASSWAVDLEGSLDGVYWTQIATTTSAIGSITNASPRPMLYFRMKESGLSGASTVTATAIGVAD